jgi:hypothetical protein
VVINVVDRDLVSAPHRHLAHVAHEVAIMLVDAGKAPRSARSTA